MPNEGGARRKRLKMEEGTCSDDVLLWDECADARDFIEIPPQQQQLLEQEHESILPPQPGKPATRGSLPVKDLERVSRHFSSGTLHESRASTAESVSPSVVSNHEDSGSEDHSSDTETYSWEESQQQKRVRGASVHSRSSQADSEASSSSDAIDSGFHMTIDEEQAEMDALARPAHTDKETEYAMQPAEQFGQPLEMIGVNSQMGLKDAADYRTIDNGVKRSAQVSEEDDPEFWEKVHSISTDSGDELSVIEGEEAPPQGKFDHDAKIATQAAWIRATQQAHIRAAQTADKDEGLPKGLEGLQEGLRDTSRTLDDGRHSLHPSPIFGIKQLGSNPLSPHERQISALGDFASEGRLAMLATATGQPVERRDEVRSEPTVHRTHEISASSDNGSDEEPAMELEPPRRLTKKMKPLRTSARVHQTQPGGVSPSLGMHARKAVSTYNDPPRAISQASHKDVGKREEPVVQVGRTPLHTEKARHLPLNHDQGNDFVIPASIVPSSGLSPRSNTNAKQGHSKPAQREPQPPKTIQHASPKRKQPEPAATAAPDGKRIKLLKSSTLRMSSPEEEVPDPAVAMRQEKAAFIRKASLERARLQQSKEATNGSSVSVDSAPQHVVRVPSENSRSETLPISPPPPTKAVVPLSLYRRFRQAYPTYEASEEHFTKLCQEIRDEASKRSLHRSLWDDFVFQHFARYAAHVYHRMRSGSEPMVYGAWYQDEVEEPECRRRILTPATLDEICPTVENKSTTEKAVENRSTTEKAVEIKSATGKTVGNKSTAERKGKNEELAQPASADREEKRAVEISPPTTTSGETDRTTGTGNPQGTPASASHRTLPWKHPHSPLGSTPRTQHGSTPRTQPGSTPRTQPGSTPSRKPGGFSFADYIPGFKKGKKNGADRRS